MINPQVIPIPIGLAKDAYSAGPIGKNEIRSAVY